MTTTSSKKASDILSKGYDLASILNRVKKLGDLEKIVMPNLEPTIRPYCKMGGITEKTLTLIVANSAIATQLRFQLNELLFKFKQSPSLRFVQSIELKIRPANEYTTRMNKHDTPAPPLAPLSKETAHTVNMIAETMTDPQLKNALKRIASHTDKKNIVP